MGKPLKQKFILISIVSPAYTKIEAMEDLDELKSLVSTYGGADVIDVIQRRMHPSGGNCRDGGKEKNRYHRHQRHRKPHATLSYPTTLLALQSQYRSLGPRRLNTSYF